MSDKRYLSVFPQIAGQSVLKRFLPYAKPQELSSPDHEKKKTIQDNIEDCSKLLEDFLHTSKTQTELSLLSSPPLENQYSSQMRDLTRSILSLSHSHQLSSVPIAVFCALVAELAVYEQTLLNLSSPLPSAPKEAPIEPFSNTFLSSLLSHANLHPPSHTFPQPKNAHPPSLPQTTQIPSTLSPNLPPSISPPFPSSLSPHLPSLSSLSHPRPISPPLSHQSTKKSSTDLHYPFHLLEKVEAQQKEKRRLEEILEKKAPASLPKYIQHAIASAGIFINESKASSAAPSCVTEGGAGGACVTPRTAVRSGRLNGEEKSNASFFSPRRSVKSGTKNLNVSFVQPRSQERVYRSNTGVTLPLDGESVIPVERLPLAEMFVEAKSSRPSLMNSPVNSHYYGLVSKERGETKEAKDGREEVDGREEREEREWRRKEREKLEGRERESLFRSSYSMREDGGVGRSVYLDGTNVSSCSMASSKETILFNPYLVFN